MFSRRASGLVPQGLLTGAHGCVCARAWLQVDIISARGAFEASFPGDSHAWKMHAFLQVRLRLPPTPSHPPLLPRSSAAGATRTWQRAPSCANVAVSAPCARARVWPAQVQNKLQLEAVTNLVSVGDSHIEMDAVHLLGRSFAHALVKTVKLWERPTPYELQKQLEVVADKLPDIYRAGTTLNIWLEREGAQG